MADLPPPSKPGWFVASVHRVHLTCLSDCHFWLSHWDATAGRSRRCGGASCALCALGMRPVYRFVFLAEDAMHRDFWLELREAHRSTIEEANDVASGCAGAVLCVYRRGPGKRAPVVVDYIERVARLEIDVSLFVSSLGLPPVLSE